MYEYQATLLRVIDGDTIDARVDLGFSVFVDMRLRLLGINAPEMRRDDNMGHLAKDHLLQLLGGAEQLRIRTQKDRREKYGRFLATLFAGEVNVNDRMVLDGHAVEATY